MSIEQINTLSALNGLMASCGGSYYGFALAGAEMADARLKPLLIAIGEQHAAFLRELRDLAARFGGGEDPATVDLGSRRWDRLHDAAAHNDVHAVLAECEDAEAATLGSYRQALGIERLLADARTVVARQLESVRQTQNQIHQLREQTGP